MSPSIWWDDFSIYRLVDSIDHKPPLKIWLDTGTNEPGWERTASFARRAHRRLDPLRRSAIQRDRRRRTHRGGVGRAGRSSVEVLFPPPPPRSGVINSPPRLLNRTRLPVLCRAARRPPLSILAADRRDRRRIWRQPGRGVGAGSISAGGFFGIYCSEVYRNSGRTTVYRSVRPCQNNWEEEGGEDPQGTDFISKYSCPHYMAWSISFWHLQFHARRKR